MDKISGKLVIKNEAHKHNTLLLSWFSGIFGFFLFIAAILTALILEKGYKITLYYEPNQFISRGEIFLMLFVLIITTWIAYKYASRTSFFRDCEKKVSFIAWKKRDTMKHVRKIYSQVFLCFFINDTPSSNLMTDTH